MRLTIATITLLATTAMAVAIPDPQHWGCTRPGQSCKREALPEPEPEAEPQHWGCTRPGQSC